MNETLGKCPVCENIGFRIHECEDGEEMYICNKCGVCLFEDELEAHKERP